MKKVVMCVMTVVLSLLFNPKGLNAATVSRATINTETSVKGTRMAVLTNRLNEIKALTKSNLSVEEKKELRNEVLTIKKEVHNHPVIISGGALLLIIILLIILL